MKTIDTSTIVDSVGMQQAFNPALEVNLLRNICQKSFYRFVQEFWHEAVAEKPVWNWHVEYLCQKVQDLLEDVEAGRPKKHDLIINLPPGSSKSSLFSILFPAFVHARMPSCRFITASFNLDLAIEFGRKSKVVMQSELYRKCYGRFKFTPERKTHYTNQYKGERLVFTTQQSPTGQHAHFILIDDPVDPLDQDREVQIQNINTWMNRVIRSRTVDAQMTPLILIMQRLSENDPTGEWLEKTGGENVLHIKLPASLHDGATVNPPGLRRYYVDGLFDPKRLPKSVLDERKKWMSVSDYSAQYDQNPLPAEGLMFKVQHLRVIPALDPLDPIVAKVRYWDKAVSTKVNACFTVGVLMGRTASGKFIVLDVQRGQWDAATRESIILNTAKADGVRTLVALEMEPGSGGLESAQYSVRNLAGFPVYIDRAVKSKVSRAEPLAIQVQHYNVSLLEGPWNASLLSEVAGFPQQRTKDQVDSMVGAFNMLCMSQDRTAGAL